MGDEAERDEAELPIGLRRDNVGFLLARAAQRWHDALAEQFTEAGYPQMRPAYHSILIPLFEEDGLRLGELGRRAGLSKQTMTTMVAKIEKSGLVVRKHDELDGRAVRVYLTDLARDRARIAEKAIGNLDALAISLADDLDPGRLRVWLREMASLGR